MKPVFKKCVDCRKVFTQKHPQQVRCPECQRVHVKRMSKEYRKKHAKPVKPKDPNECSRIKSCKYGGMMGGIPICDYISITGKRRPCPVQGCTEYARKGKGRSRAKEKQNEWNTIKETE
ncbi:MAG: hypothetical protein ACI4S2_12455 [Lachnospiraceae bacterium]